MGTRLGADVPKALVPVAGEPLIVRTLRRFATLELVEGAVITVPPEHRDAIKTAVTAAFAGREFLFVNGGAERQLSVGNGLDALDPATEIVVIHDAARPFVSSESIAGSIKAAAQHGAATVAIPASDTILAADDERFLFDTPDRSRLWACQTPQTFRVPVIREAHTRARQEGLLATDDASLARQYGARVQLVMGSPLNFKVTTAGDLALAECVIAGGLA